MPSVSRFEVPDLGIGVGFRVPHYRQVVDERPEMDWFEVISENFMVDGGRPLHWLDRLADAYPVVPHGVAMSVAGVEHPEHTARLRTLLDRLAPPWFSDHLCFTGTEALTTHDLLPVPYTDAVRDHIVDRIKRVQDVTGRLFAVENVSSYLTYKASTVPEWDFLADVLERADCAMLLDVNNIFVSAQNHGFDPAVFLDALPHDRVVQIHLAGHSIKDGYRLDTHDAPVCDEVWDLYAAAVRKVGSVSTLIEWDGHIPTFERLQQEARRAREVRDEALSELPTDWRDRMVQLVSGQVPADGALFAGGPTLTPEQQIGIYRGQYVLRLTEAIEDDLLGLRALVGRPTLHAWVLDYLREHPSRSWTLNRASRGFADWLAERDPEPLHLEMARIDTAVQTGIVAAEGAPLTLADLASLPDLALPPHLTLLRHTTNAHALRGALLTGGDVPPTATGDFPVAVYRRGIAMKSEVLDPAAWAVLRSIGDGLGVLEALDGVVRAGLVAPSEVEGAVAGWFRLFASEGLVTRRET